MYATDCGVVLMKNIGGKKQDTELKVNKKTSGIERYFWIINKCSILPYEQSENG